MPVSQLIPAGSVALPAAADALQSAEAQTARWLDTPVGRLDVPIPAEDPLTLAKNGSLLANLINQVQLEASGADISLTSLSNRVVDFPQDVTVRAIVSAYAFPNTLQTIRVTRAVLTAALERSLSYFDFAPDGSLCISDTFLRPIIQHFNYDYFSGLTVTARPLPAGRSARAVHRLPGQRAA